MAYTALPMLFYNLGGEMLYVLDQRLVAQNIATDKAVTVMYDITKAMFNFDSYKEMAKTQVLYSKDALKVIFKKIVHSSIMKVNTDSMDKLYDLMVMSVKYQILHCNTAKELFHVVLNHLDGAMEFVSSNTILAESIKTIFCNLVEMYGSLTFTEYILLKQTLLCFMQGSNNKVSIYLSLEKQNDEGQFVITKEGEMPENYDVPGTITIYKTDKSGKVTPVISKFETGCSFKPSSTQYYGNNFSDEIFGRRCTKLGTNIYKEEYNLVSSLNSQKTSSATGIDSSRYAQAELGLLAHIIGSEKRDSSAFEFKLSFFSDDELKDETKPSTSVPSPSPPHHNVVSIVPAKSGTDALSQIMEDLTIKPANKSTSRGEDLLSLMDS